MAAQARRLAPLYYLWAAGMVLALGALIGIFYYYVTAGSRLLPEAVKNGQWARIELASGLVEGQVRISGQSIDQGKQQSANTPIELPESAPLPDNTLPAIGLLPRSEKSLDVAPVDDLMQKSRHGNIPVKIDEAHMPALHYAKPFVAPSKRPLVAILFTGLGQDSVLTSKALELPDAISLSFSPYARDLPTWMQNARNSGFETYFDLPLENDGYPASDPGPLGILGTNVQTAIQVQTKKILAQFPGVVGVAALPGERFSFYSASVPILTGELDKRGMYLICDSSNSGFASVLATKASVKGTCADASFTRKASREDIQKGLQTLEELAKKRGYAIGMVEANNTSLSVLSEWSGSINAKGMALAPISYTIRGPALK